MKKTLSFVCYWTIPILLASCCGFVSKSEYTVYRGKLDTTIADSTVEIFADNITYGVGLFRNGNSKPAGSPTHPNASGYFLISGTTPPHNECEHPNHWEGGSLEIFIQGTHIKDFHDTLSVEELQALSLLNADSLGIHLSSNEIGIWKLPDIILKPK